MIATLGPICASLLGVQRWVRNDSQLMTMTEWQGGPQMSWIPHYKPVTADYEPDHISRELSLFAMALVIGIWAFRNRNHKIDRIFARGVLGLCVAGAIYLSLLWLARQHVEGDWTALPPRLVKYEVDTPEFLEKQAAQREYFQQMEYKRLGHTP